MSEKESMSEKTVTAIEVVEDRTAGSLCDEGFLRLRRLRVRTVYDDGSHSATYDCDVLSRRAIDAVAILLYEIDGERQVRVALKEGVRPPVYLRREKQLVQPDAGDWATLTEMAAGVLEPEDTGEQGVAERAVAEAREECGLDVPPSAVAPLGGPMFPSPGVTDEKVFFVAAPAVLGGAGRIEGDGSVMEEATRIVVLELREAIERCRTARIPDMKTELALLRLCEQLGYLPQLGMFRDELPPELAARWATLGVEAAE